MSAISKAVRTAVLAKLSDPSAGFNANLATAIGSGDYGDAAAFTIDWSANSRQFFQGALGPDDIDESTPSQYPMVMLYSISSANRNLQKFTEFSGLVNIGLDFHLTWKDARVLAAFDDLGDAVEDAVFATLNARAAQTWNAPIAYNGDLAASRARLEMAGEFWRQTIAFRSSFEVDTN